MGCCGAMTATEDIVRQLIDAARAARKNGYAPYSRFKVGAAVLLTDGEIVVGANFENASLGLSLCAETVALAAANALGRFADIDAIAVVGGPTESSDEGQGSKHAVTPCGRCRQILNEAQQVAGRPISVHCAPLYGDTMVEHSVTSLLPFAFGPNDLGITPQRKS